MNVIAEAPSVVLENQRYSLEDANSILRLIMEMQAKERQTHIVLVQAMCAHNALTSPLKRSIAKVANSLDISLPHNYESLVGPVVRSRIASKERCIIHATPFRAN